MLFKCGEYLPAPKTGPYVVDHILHTLPPAPAHTACGVRGAVYSSVEWWVVVYLSCVVYAGKLNTSHGDLLTFYLLPAWFPFPFCKFVLSIISFRSLHLFFFYHNCFFLYKLLLFMGAQGMPIRYLLL